MGTGSDGICGKQMRRPWLAWATLWPLVSAVSAATPCTVDGIVRNSVTGQPVAHAIVRMISTGGDRVGYVATTVETGAYHFDQVEPGEYLMSAERTGFRSAGSAVRLVAGQKAEGEELRVAPLGSITGRVLDSDGEPVPEARIVAIRPTWVRGARLYRETDSAQANDSGEFRLADLDPGRYRLIAKAPDSNPLRFSISEGPGQPEYHLGPAYYPSGQDLDGAAPVDVAAGQELTGIEFKLPMLPVFHVRGQSAAPSGNWNGPTFVSATRVDNGRAAPWFADGASLKKGGGFDLGALPAGVYVVSVNRIDQAVTQSVSVTVKSRDVDGIALAELRPATVRVHFTYRGDAAQNHSEPGLLLERTEGPGHLAVGFGEFGFSHRAMHQSDGSLLFENVSPGKYLPVLAAKDDWYAQSMTFNGQEAREIEVTDGSIGELDVILAPGTASISGVLVSPAEAEVVAVAEDATAGNAALRTAAVDQDGRFSVMRLVPGRYLVFAVPAGGDWPWLNAEFLRLMRGQAAEVELAEKGSAQVQVTLLSEEALRRAEDQIP